MRMRITGLVLPLGLWTIAACSSAAKHESVDATTPDDSSEVAAATTPPASGAAPQDLGADAERLSLAQQKREFMVQSHLQQAAELLDRLQLEEARRELGLAYELDPENAEVKRKLSEVGAMLGLPGDTWGTVAEQLGDEYELRIQQLKAEAGDSLRRGKLALGRRDYDKALAELRLTLNHIQWAPYSIDWGGIDTQAQALLTRAETERDMAATAQREAQQQAATEALRERENQDDNRRQALVSNIIGQAIDAFEDARYDEAVSLADEALRKSPRNEQALELRDAAFRAGRDKVRADYITEKREEFALWREDLQELQIPWTDVITYPDRDKWKQITDRRRSRRGLDLSKRVSSSEAELREQIATQTVRLPGIEEEESLRAVIDLIRNFTGLPLIVDPAAENAVLDEGIVFDFSFDNELSVAQALNLITEMAGEEVSWTLRHDAILVTTREKARGELIIYNHDVQDLIMGLTSFTGPRIDRLRLLDELEDDDGGGPFGGILESRASIEIDELATLISENVAVETWEEDEGVSIEAGEGFILIVHSVEVQAEVKEFLEDLRRFNSSLVTIESKFMTVADNWIQEIGVDFRGLDSFDVSDVTNGLEDMASRGLDNGGTGNSGQGAAGAPSAGFYYDDGQDGDLRATTQNYFGNALGDALSVIGGLTFQLTFLNDAQLSLILRAVEKSSQFELVNSQMLSVHNTQRAYVTVINQRAYIQDFDVEVAQFQAVADPQVNVLHEGVVLDVRPTIHHDRKFLTLEIQPTVATVVALRDFSTTLGGNTSPVSFQLPELEVQSVNTSALIPDGGSILLGGLSQIRNIERRAEVPWLARIPIVGFLFKQEGYSDERRSLMILIKARITDVREAVQERLEAGY
ncbi:MAG: hypothetical protein ACI8QZ_002584 [Chlamydiales bacterium]|jgi:tetratricopeptide (TPR) repeat protein